jgi:hypothetical protein
MDRLSMKHLALAVALAFAGTGALAHGTKDKTADAGDTAVKPGMATSADTGTVPNYAGAEGVKSTPGASDEDHNDEGASRGKSATAPHGKAYGYDKNDTNPGQSLKDSGDATTGSAATTSTSPDINSTATPSSTEGTVSPSTTTTK